MGREQGACLTGVLRGEGCSGVVAGAAMVMLVNRELVKAEGASESGGRE